MKYTQIVYGEGRFDAWKQARIGLKFSGENGQRLILRLDMPLANLMSNCGQSLPGTKCHRVPDWFLEEVGQNRREVGHAVGHAMSKFLILVSAGKPL